MVPPAKVCLRQRPGKPGLGHYRSPRHHKNLWASDRSQSTADIARDPSDATKSPLRSFSLVSGPASRGPWSNGCSRRDRAGALDPMQPLPVQLERRTRSGRGQSSPAAVCRVSARLQTFTNTSSKRHHANAYRPAQPRYAVALFTTTTLPTSGRVRVSARNYS